MVVSVLTILMMTGSALGGGLAILRLVGPSDDFDPLVRLASAFVLGIGAVGWLGFFFALSGLLGPVWLLTMLTVPLLGFLCWDARTAEASIATLREGGTPRILLAILALVLLLNLLEGLAPPIDADSLAYHFALPKQFLREGHLIFEPKAIESAVPLLLHMTYMAALGLGGETALTLWTMVSGWAAGALLFALCRVHVGRRWALAVTLIFLTTPAVVYGAGSGQLEVRTAAFVLAATFWALQAAKTGRAGTAALAGLAAGFFAASKYTGLLFFAVLGVGLLIRGRRLGPAMAFGVAVLVAGSQWYAWNWWNTGDPLFPTLYGIVPYHPDTPWNADALRTLREFFIASEKPVPANLLWLLVYPFAATLAPLPAFESLRVGFGPYVLLILPLALAAVWVRRRTAYRSDWLFYGLVCFAAYALWFFVGPSLRLRHLLPLYPLLLVVASVAAIRSTTLWPALTAPLAAALGLTLLIQVGGQGLFSLKYAQRIVHGETRDAFLDRIIPSFEVVRWVNKNLPADAHLMSMVREVVYLFDVPAFMAHPIYQHEVSVQKNDPRFEALWRQMTRKRLTYVLLYVQSAIGPAMQALQRNGCAKELKVFHLISLMSRTLGIREASGYDLVLYRLTPESCPFSAATGTGRP